MGTICLIHKITRLHLSLSLILCLGIFGYGNANQKIIGGEIAPTCGWPTTLMTEAECTATLIHPRAISTAQHCGEPGVTLFGDAPPDRSTFIDIVRCVTEGSEDAMICELAEPVTQIPVTPILFGCEIDKYMKVGQDVVLAGYGEIDTSGFTGGVKYWVNQKIAGVEPERTIIGEAGDGKSPCRGDSGGPVFVQTEDGSWRVFGTVFKGTTEIPCNSAADLQRLDPVVPHFEEASGIDITPCFDGKTGAWDPSEDCGNFFAGSEKGSGDWSNWCEGTPKSSLSSECGDPYGSASLLQQTRNLNLFDINQQGFKFYINSRSSHTLQLINASGKMLGSKAIAASTPLSSNMIEYNWEINLQPGVYIIQIEEKKQSGQTMNHQQKFSLLAE